jgi:predicted deacylase
VEIAGVRISPGTQAEFEIPVSRLPTGTPVALNGVALCGKRPGPRVWLSAAIHGDEVNGIEIIRRVLGSLNPRTLGGSVIAIPVVNVFGFVNESRYLPDRRDLNRSFPGSARGSLAARIAHLFMTEVVQQCDYGIDLHTGAHHRRNLPQVRGDLDDELTRSSAIAFGAPVMLHAKLRDGSLREAAKRIGVHVLLFEGGEAFRFDDTTIQAGYDGVLSVLSELGMIRKRKRKRTAVFESYNSRWGRAVRAGLLIPSTKLGARVRKGDSLGFIRDAMGVGLGPVRAPCDGMVIGLTTKALVNRGDALVHVAEGKVSS